MTYATNNLLAEHRVEPTLRPHTEESLRLLVNSLKMELQPRLTLPLLPGEKAENASRAQMVEASIRHTFRPERQEEQGFLDLIEKVREKALLHLIQDGLFLETNYPYGSSTRKVVSDGCGPMGLGCDFVPINEVPYIEVRRLAPGDGPGLSVGYPELTAFCRFFRAHHIIF